MSDPALGQILAIGYDPVTVMISIVLACFAGVTGLMLADHVMGALRPVSRFWWIGGAIPMGCGIWAMHFTGMLAARVDGLAQMHYSLGLTLISLVPAIIASAAALYFSSQSRPIRSRLQICALGLASGIGAMHYTGMEAMQMPGLRYDFPLFVLSLLVAHGLAFAALRIRFGIRGFRSLSTHTTTIMAGIIFGVAVAGMHYTAMAAASFHEITGHVYPEAGLSEMALANAIVGFAITVLGLALAATWMDNRSQRQRHIEIEHIAKTDSLTGLPNRAFFDQYLEQALREAQATDSRFALMFLDLNDFKAVNDSSGHAVGDRFLRECANRLRSTLRAQDTMARFGGDEFVFLLTGIGSSADAACCAERFLDCMDGPIEIDDRTFHVSGSVGLSLYPDDGKTPDGLIQAADAAMYQAKRSRSRYQFFDRQIVDDARERLRLVSDLQQAIQDDQLSFHYQPLVNLDTGRWVGVEALMRWNHPQEGFLSPEIFIPMAERGGLLPRLEEWALRQACEQARAWKDQGFNFGRISVNVSATEFARPDFVERVKTVLDDAAVRGDAIELEITESSLMHQDDATIKRLHRLRALGITLAIDDFGTGYSSLSYLKSLPIDRIKIDRCFVNGIADDPKDKAVILAITEMSASFGFNVLAEGIEHEHQRIALMALGCEFGQGYLFARPVAPEILDSEAAHARFRESPPPANESGEPIKDV